MTAPTPDEVAKARIYFAEPLDVVARVLPQMARHVRVLLAALDAAERERERLRVALGGYPDSDLVSLATTLRTRNTAAEASIERLTRERDELSALIPALRESLATAHERAGRMERERALSPGAIVVSLDAETREAAAKALYEREYPSDGTWWTHADQQEWWDRADAVLAALRGVGR